MRTKLTALLVGVTVGTAVALGSGVVSAERPGPVGAHRHFIVENGVNVYVGPNFCDVDAAEQGFAGFHHKVHITDPGLVDVMSEGCP